MKVAFQKIKEIYIEAGCFLLGPGVFLIIESLEGSLSPGSLLGLALHCSSHSTRSLDFIFVIYSSSIYESLNYARYHLDCRD